MLAFTVTQLYYVTVIYLQVCLILFTSEGQTVLTPQEEQP